MKKLSFRIVGEAPLIMHNGRLADPSDEYARAIKTISSNRKKMDSDFENMAHLEWQGGLYLRKGEPCIPGKVIEAVLIGKGGGARKERMGKEAAAALWVIKDFPLEYDGPKDPKELWKDEQYRFRALVKVQTARIMRMRPIFPEWAANIEVQYNENLLDEDVIKRWVEVAGAEVGLMDWRPKFGRFTVEW